MTKCRNLIIFISFFLVIILTAGILIPVFGTSDKKTGNGSSDISDVQWINELPAFSTELDSKAAVLMDADSGTVFFEKNSHERLAPASVTKVMTLLLIAEALENGRITVDDVVTISEKAAGMGGSQMYMEPGETHTVDELLTGIAMVSANDACVAVAEFISGSVDIFVEQMNSRAKELKLENTHFVNTNGLPVADHYSSAYDIAIMSAKLVACKTVIPYLTAPEGVIEVGIEGKEKTSLEMINTNKLLKTYNGAFGIKTGFTQDAGYCLSAAAEREGLTLIAVVLGASSSKIRFDETAQLLDYGYANIESVNIASKGEYVGNVTVNKGVYVSTDLKTDRDIKILVPRGNGNQVSFSIHPAEDLTAPVKEGDIAGSIVIKRNDKTIGKYDLLSASNVEKASIPARISRKIDSILH